MERIAFKMKLKPGMISEYTRRHNEIWLEITNLLKENGVSDYAIFFDEETNILFGVQKVDGDTNSQVLGEKEIIQKWWKYMADIMEVNKDFSPITTPLKEVFYMQ